MRFSGFCPMLQCWLSFLSHYYNFLQFSLSYFTTLPNVTYSLSLWFVLPTGSTLLFSLFNSPCCSSICWNYLVCRSALCSTFYPFSAKYKQYWILSSKSLRKILLELNMDWTLTFLFNPFLNLTSKHWWIVFVDSF